MGYIHVQTFNNALVSPTSVVGMGGAAAPYGGRSWVAVNSPCRPQSGL